MHSQQADYNSHCNSLKGLLIFSIPTKSIDQMSNNFECNCLSKYIFACGMDHTYFKSIPFSIVQSSIM